MPTSNRFAPSRLSRLTATCVVALIVLASSVTASAQSFSVVVDFGNPGGRQPYGRLEEGPDGCLYGTAVAGGKAHGTIFSVCAGVHKTVYTFTGIGDGSYPEAGLTLGSDGQFYGVTRFGAGSNKGTIFKFNPSTKVLTTLHVFNGGNGAEARAEVGIGTDGRLYGVTSSGGSGNMGTVFSIDRSGGGFTTLRSFTGANGRMPTGSMVQATDGFWYGTTSGGGASNFGTIFRINAAGTLSTLHSFAGANGSIPRGGLVRGAGGELYGMTIAGGSANQGTAFKIDLGGRFTLLRSFTGPNGANPSAELTYCRDGWYYGTTTFGGSQGSGVVFRMDGAGNLTVLRSLGPNDGIRPEAALMESTGGRLYGTTPVGGPSGAAGTVFEVTPAGGFTRLVAFSGSPAMPYGPLFEGSDGGLYGTSFEGGTAGAGSIFRATRSGEVEVLHGYSGLTDGLGPNDGVVKGADGGIYMSAAEGGSGTVGTLGKYASNTFTLLATMTSTGANGYYPRSNPVQMSDGGFYGVMSGGGSSSFGTIYKMTPGGGMTVLYAFNGTTKGRTPYGRLMIGRDGLLYGTTMSGGPAMVGVLFSFDPGSKVLTVLHSFSGTDGATPYGGVVQGSDGRLYGTTSGGGAAGHGTIFAFDLGSRQLTRLYSFDLKTGAAPYATLIEGTDGRLYGTASIGGGSNVGSVFAIQKNGSNFALLHSFRRTDGAFPRAGLVQATDGNLYGTAPAGGSANTGVIFRVSPSGSGEPPPPPPPPPGGSTITVTSPNGPSTTWVVGQKGKVTWTSNLPTTDKVKIELSLDGGATYPIVIKARTGNDGRQGILVPAAWRTTRGRVRVSSYKDATVKDASDQDFVIR